MESVCLGNASLRLQRNVSGQEIGGWNADPDGKLLDRLALWEDDQERCPATSMGIDEALMECVELPVLRTYHWSRACVSIGYFTSSKSLQGEVKPPGIIRRLTGGGLVHHGSDWPFSVAVPSSHPFYSLRPQESYRVIHHALLAALRGYRPDAASLFSMSDTDSAIQSDFCFKKPVAHDILFDRTKIAGGGQKRTRRGFLYQGSLQVRADYQPPPPHLASALSERVEIFKPTGEIFQRGEELAQSRYLNAEWTLKF